MSNITIQPADGTWVVRTAGAVIGESRNALELLEDGHDPVIYFPRSDIAMAFLDPSETKTTCPLKGEASHFDIIAKNGAIADAGWSYETPKDAVSEIAGHIAFYADKVAIENV